MPFFMLSALFSSFANFFETSYIVVKKTTGGFITFLFGAIVCVIAQVLLIPLFGFNAWILNNVFISCQGYAKICGDSD
ncbi:hypothetical protein [Lactococcus lactis]|uniref:hypothetical protein n=1 Tax=Lactococcus lactis TaxID=1358 RepID=UPI003D11DF43